LKEEDKQHKEDEQVRTQGLADGSHEQLRQKCCMIVNDVEEMKRMIDILKSHLNILSKANDDTKERERSEMRG
jgi:hypothetical protein